MRAPASLKTLSVFSLVMITIGSVDSIRNLPATALFGSSLIFFFIIAALFFFLPAALVSAELSAAIPEQGGIYVWVKKAFGAPIGFAAIWFQWIENVIWYPTILSFVAGTIGYLIAPDLADNRLFLIAVILISFWGATIINLLGMKTSAWFSSFCAITGLLLPMSLIITLGALWIQAGHPLQIQFGIQDLLPHLNRPDTWVAMTGVVLSLCGIEIATVHARDVRNPQKSFPQALVYSTVIILSTLILGSLSIAIVIPADKINLLAGLMEAFDAFFTMYHSRWLLPFIAGTLVIGSIGSVNNWIIAPTKGLLVAAQEGFLPPKLQPENSRGAPKALLIYQALIVSLVALVFLLIPSVNGSYWFLTALAAQLYMLMYMLMFLTAIYLRRQVPTLHRPFKAGDAAWKLYFIAGCGLFGCVVTFLIGFIPPNNMNIGSIWHYELLLITGLILMSIPPFILAKVAKPSWKPM